MILLGLYNDREVKLYGQYGYSYGKTIHTPCDIPTNSYVSKVFQRVADTYPEQTFNSVLVTKFTDGNSSIPMHSDDEVDIDRTSNILTVSLGATRTVNFWDKKVVL